MSDDVPRQHAGLPSPRAWARSWAVWAAAATLWLAWSIGLRPLTLPDEGRYAGVAWEMLRSGDWIVPTENGLPFFHKPPLFYWITAASMQLFGADAAAARVAPLLGALLGGLGVVGCVRRRMGDATARWTLLVLATLPFFFGAAQFANLDLLVAAFIALTIVFAAEASLASQQGRRYMGALCGAWACAALGVLAKGLIGLVLPGLVLVAWLLLERRPRTIVRLLSPLGLAVFALIAVPWFVAVQQRHEGFLHFFFVYQHFERFAAGGFNNAQPWWFFLVAVPALTLPWSLWLLGARRLSRDGDPPDASPVRRLMWVWLGGVLVFFSIPQSKPVGYAVPVLFPIAVLVADAIVAALRGAPAGARRAVVASAASAFVAVALCMGAVATSALTYDRDHTSLARTLARVRADGDPVVFVGEFLFDVALHARLPEPVPVTGHWRDPKIAERDNWRRELAEAAPFAPALAARLLVTTEQGLALRCGTRPLWAIATLDNEHHVATLPGATRMFAANRAALWRLAPADCATPRMAP